MKNFNIATRYARALIELATAKENIDAFGNELKDFLDTLAHNPTIAEFLNDPRSSERGREELTNAVLKSSTYNPLVINFLKLLTKKNRLVLLDVISEKYLQLADQILGRQPLVIVSATQMAEGDVNRVSEIFAKRSQRKMIVKTQIDPNVLGGLQVQMGNHIFDYTLKRHLQDIKRIVS